MNVLRLTPPGLLRMPKRPKRKTPLKQQSDARAAHVFMTPWFLGIAIVTAGPLLASAYLTFTKYNMIGSPKWVGLENYRRLFTDDRLLQSLKVTFTYVLVGVPLALIAALLLALVLNRGIRGLTIYRSVFYLPSLFAGSVAIGVLWRQVFGAKGIVNSVLSWLGYDISGKSWVGDTKTALLTLIILHVWTFGSSMIIFLAGLRQISAELYEAASLDGAGTWQKFRYITLPQLSPIIFFNLVMGIINSFQNFTQAFVVSGGDGGPADSTLLYSLYMYTQAFGSAKNMGYASVLGWLLVLIIGAFTALNFVISKKWVYYEQ